MKIVYLKTADMKEFKSNIEEDTLNNKDFRKVMYTSKYLQLVLMSLKPGEDTGPEIHNNNIQLLHFERGKGKCIIDGFELPVEKGDEIVVPPGSNHNVINTDATEELKMYAIYTRPKTDIADTAKEFS
jgi:mannose-6-phosphate isomerase-like protein (cupin superfamily)